MNVAELQWIVGIALTTVLTIGGIAVGAFRAMSGKLDRVAEKMTSDMRSGDDVLHKRINDTNKEMADRYVRRDDLDGHLERIDRNLGEIRQDQKELLRQLAGRPARRG